MSQEHQQSLPIGSAIGRYTVTEILGEGGFGIVYKANDPKLERFVVLKEYLPEECAARNADGQTVIPRSKRSENYHFGLDRFLDEAKRLVTLNNPNIVSAIDFIEENSTAYLVMDYEQGEDLNDYLKRISFKSAAAQGKGMPESEILSIIKPILNGLNAVHEKGLLHRDIKPGNIYLRRNQEGAAGEPMLIDFGAARYALGEHSKSMSAIISMGYAPPEQYTSRGKQGAYTDLYAIGATLHELITGQAPIESVDRQLAVGDGEEDPYELLANQQNLQKKYSDILLKVIDWCLTLSSKKRPQSAQAVIKALDTGNIDFSQSIAKESDPTLTKVVEEGEHFGGESKRGKNKKTKASDSVNGANTSSTANSNDSTSKNKILPVVITLVIAFGGYFGFMQYQNHQQALAQEQALIEQAEQQRLVQEAEKQRLAQEKRLAAQARTQQIKQAQALLIKLSYQITQTGTLNKRTQKAIEAFESQQQLLVTGDVDQTLITNLTRVVNQQEKQQQLAEERAAAQRAEQARLAKIEASKVALTITTNPSSATITLLNVKEKYSKGVRLSPKDYQIKVSKNGYYSQTKTISLSKHNNRFSYNLKRLPPPKAIKQLVNNMVAIPAGSFQMGCVSGQDCSDDEKPVHRVNLPSFSMMQTEVTFAMWDACVSAGGCSHQPDDENWGRGNRPVINVSFDDITNEFIPWLNRTLAHTGKSFSLPSEAQWEYAARAGTTTKYSWGNSINCSNARYGYQIKKCGKQLSTDPVKSFSANAFGLYDMHGNVWELTQDCYNENYQGAPRNGSAWLKGICDIRMLRGGAWLQMASYLRSARRYNNYGPMQRSDEFGFRLVLSRTGR